jgi:hypothetical protein
VTEEFTFWAQPLDNSSPDHIAVRGEALSADDSKGRQHAVSLVSNVMKRGTSIFKMDGVQLTADEHHFVLEVPSDQRDKSGRIAPIVCYGNYDSTVGGALEKLVPAGLDDFAKRIGRSLQGGQLELARRSFEDLKKKASTRRLVRVIGYGAAAFIVLALAALIVLALPYYPIFWD